MGGKDEFVLLDWIEGFVELYFWRLEILLVLCFL